MDWDDIRKPQATALTLGEPLTALSIADLESRIETLKAEIIRIDHAIELKRHQATAAKAFFKSQT